jgi:hypothetical protein
VGKIAQALNVPVAALFADDFVLAEVRVSDETMEQVRRDGREASKQAAERLASRLESLIWQEATRPPVAPRTEAFPLVSTDTARLGSTALRSHPARTAAA